MGTRKTVAHYEQNDAEFAEGENSIGNHLSNHEAEGCDGRHGELLESAALAFADKAEGDHQDCHDLKKNRDQAGDEEVGGARGRVVKHGGAHLDRHRAIG